MKTVRRILESRPLRTWSTTPESSVSDALRLMAEKDIGALLVKDGPRLVGIVTERDVARKMVLEGRPSDSTPVRDIMTERVLFVGLDHTITECMALMNERRMRHLPVIAGEQVIGMISIRDVIAELIAEKAFQIEQLESYIYTIPPYHAA
ncbi:CBS domain-containing protein [Oscillochloris sp. ZM17-4]|uniref:CBS domain-containing protein n=1 Tax=Oscillochloris sp. ZM17-4 TaxID=2866714 RepID=UPI001C72B2B3|nr:CBS domain-containing protein [Oscillochloris sp. ZM17-4]MBX0327490.1 CBS domain-containing protein [Oscillochloris sp. ZM17-4]